MLFLVQIHRPEMEGYAGVKHVCFLKLCISDMYIYRYNIIFRNNIIFYYIILYYIVLYIYIYLNMYMNIHIYIYTYC